MTKITVYLHTKDYASIFTMTVDHSIEDSMLQMQKICEDSKTTVVKRSATTLLICTSDGVEECTFTSVPCY